MIISKTPFRVSFFGGGTDYPAWYREHGGQVLSTAIDKYCYISLRYLPPFFEHRMRIVYSKIENVRYIDEIKHPAIRESLRFMKFDKGLEVHHDGDLPARSGMGSSSAFTVGLLQALHALHGRMVSKRQLAEEAIHVEQDMIKETVGSQDQVAAAYGGLNNIVFKPGGEIEVRPVTITRERSDELFSHLMLFYTGIMRTASDVADSYVESLITKKERLKSMHAMVDDGIELLQSNKCICGFGELLNQAWEAKRGLSSKVSNKVVDDLYKRARDNGAIGGKITGAGGGGFLLLFVPPSAQKRVRNELSELLHIDFAMDTAGSQIVYYNPKISDYSDLDCSCRRGELGAFRELASLDDKEGGE